MGRASFLGGQADLPEVIRGMIEDDARALAARALTLRQASETHQRWGDVRWHAYCDRNGENVTLDVEVGPVPEDDPLLDRRAIKAQTNGGTLPDRYEAI